MQMPDASNIVLESLKIALGLLGTLVGGGLVLIGGWLADRRKSKNERMARERQEKALLTGMHAIRNYVADRLNDYIESRALARLESLRTAQSYVHRLIDKAPGESESLMIVVIEIGLKVDSLISTLDRRKDDPGLNDPKVLDRAVDREIEELIESLKQFDRVAEGRLRVRDEVDLSPPAALSEAAAE